MFFRLELVVDSIKMATVFFFFFFFFFNFSEFLVFENMGFENMG